MSKQTDYSALANYHTSKRLKSRKSFFEQFSYPPGLTVSDSLLKNLNLTGQEKILDLGCGFGETLIKIRKAGHQGQLTGIDLSTGMITEALKAAAGLEIDFQIQSAEKMNFAPQSFDLIICQHALYHFDLARVVPLLQKILERQGKFVVALNCFSQNSRQQIEKFKKVIAQELHDFNYLVTTERLNFENYRQFLPQFRPLHEHKYYRYLRLENPEPFVNYLSSFREYWQKIPSDKAWAKALQKVQAEIEKIIACLGYFQEEINFGISVLEKANQAANSGL